MPNLYIGRQPIYNRKLDVVAYELLYRDNDQNHARVMDGDTASSRVIINALLEIGLEHLVGKHQAFINLTRSFLLDTTFLPFPKEQMVMEVLEDVALDAEMLVALKRISQEGYTIALDDFVFHEADRHALEIADIVKIDVLALSTEAVQEHVALLKQYNLKLLAEKVETHEMLEQCQAWGFDYFQGYFLSRPKIVQGRRMPAMRLTALRTLGILQDPSLTFAHLEEVIAHDVTLSYKLLRYINSAAVGLPRKVDSIHQALIIAGTNCIRMWATLMVLSNVDDKPDSLMTTALTRAKMSELLASAMGLKDLQTFFTVGLFSTLDALLDRPLDEILDALPLSSTVKDALLHHQGLHGDVLHTVLSYEQNEGREQIQSLDIDRIRNTYLGAIKWADEISGSLPGIHQRSTSTVSAAL